MKDLNSMKLTLPAISANESYARLCVSAFASQLDPTIDEVADIRTAVSEAVTNCIIHAYKKTSGNIYINARLSENILKVTIRDKGCGIENIERAMEPLFTTGGDERSGLGFAVMQSLMDSVKVTSRSGFGTTVTMIKHIKPLNDAGERSA